MLPLCSFKKSWRQLEQDDERYSYSQNNVFSIDTVSGAHLVLCDTAVHHCQAQRTNCNIPIYRLIDKISIFRITPTPPPQNQSGSLQKMGLYTFLLVVRHNCCYSFLHFIDDFMDIVALSTSMFTHIFRSCGLYSLPSQEPQKRKSSYWQSILGSYGPIL